ncbi:hypothetical protein A1D22_01835 [Pasteurellaceae bacterium LFhippo2]|nr:hypothetical protein [Pasteurellaceae bacterium LFhippo2]
MDKNQSTKIAENILEFKEKLRNCWSDEQFQKALKSYLPQVEHYIIREISTLMSKFIQNSLDFNELYEGYTLLSNVYSDITNSPEPDEGRETLEELHQYLIGMKNKYSK